MTFVVLMAVGVWLTALLASRSERRSVTRDAASGRTGKRQLVARVTR